MLPSDIGALGAIRADGRRFVSAQSRRCRGRGGERQFVSWARFHPLGCECQLSITNSDDGMCRQSSLKNEPPAKRQSRRIKPPNQSKTGNRTRKMGFTCCWVRRPEGRPVGFFFLLRSKEEEEDGALVPLSVFLLLLVWTKCERRPFWRNLSREIQIINGIKAEVRRN